MSKSKKYELNIDNLAKVAGGYDWDDPDSLCDPANPQWIPGSVTFYCEFPLCGAPLTVPYIHSGNGLIKDYRHMPNALSAAEYVPLNRRISSTPMERLLKHTQVYLLIITSAIYCPNPSYGCL